MAEIDEHHDILILGAGLSGISTAHVLREKLPGRQFTILEGRSVVGGTWNFFKYPGFRSDSNMTTFGFSWHPWPHRHKIAAGHEIASYIEDAARTDGTYKRIRFNHKVTGLEWRDEDAFWRLAVNAGGTAKTFAADFIICCTGYYSYERAMSAPIPGLDSFQGTVAHPQWWPEDLDYAGKKVVVVGSGATAVTLVPVLAETAGSVTMLQRSPSYAASIPTRSWTDDVLRFLLPLRWAHLIYWWKDMAYEIFMGQFFRRFPRAGRQLLRLGAKLDLPRGFDVDTHFNPRYPPFDQRLCLCPDGDFFRAMHRDNTEMVTDVIDTVKPRGIKLQSGRELDADVIITATGLYFEIMGGMRPVVNGKEVDPGAHYAWRGVMLETVPNLGYVMGYVDQSWTPGADAVTRLIVRLLKRMTQLGASKAVPEFDYAEKKAPTQLAVNLSSSYFVKAADRIPKVTGSDPWYGRVHWMRDIWTLLFGNIDEGLRYTLPDKKTV